MMAFGIISSKDVGSRTCEHDSVVEEEGVLHGESDIALEGSKPGDQIDSFVLIEVGDISHVHDHLNIDGPLFVSGLFVQLAH